MCRSSRTLSHAQRTASPLLVCTLAVTLRLLLSLEPRLLLQPDGPHLVHLHLPHNAVQHLEGRATGGAERRMASASAGWDAQTGGEGEVLWRTGCARPIAGSPCDASGIAHLLGRPGLPVLPQIPRPHTLRTPARSTTEHACRSGMPRPTPRLTRRTAFSSASLRLGLGPRLRGAAAPLSPPPPGLGFASTGSGSCRRRWDKQQGGKG